ncbi:MAG: DUF456 domain-containing protein [Verrucomicrobia bacterium]|nr:DUF456 domain-containing protein [Verrucomicrobiota bacterium]
METITQNAQSGGIYALIVLLCLAGVALSMVSLSGTWAVALAALSARLLPGEATVGWGLVLGYIVVSALVEGVEAVAGVWGVQRRGGSRMAGLAAFVGGLVGLVLGGFIPVPPVGSLLGMLAGSFSLVYVVERRRLQQAQPAAHIAWGAVLSRMAVMMIKVLVTLAMVIGLAVALRPD